MSIVLALLMVAAPTGVGPSPGEKMDMRDRTRGVTPASGLFLIPPKIPDCRTQLQADAALQAKRNGELEPCDPERFLRAR